MNVDASLIRLPRWAKLPVVPANDATHLREFGAADADTRGPTKPIQHHSTNLLLHQLSEISRTFRSCGDQIWGFGFDPMSIPILFFVKSDAEEGSFGICSGPVEMSKLERVEGAHCQEIRRLGTHQRRRDDPPEGDPTFRLVNDPVIDYYAPDDGAEVSFAGEFGETECLLFDFGGRNYEPSSWEFARFVVHEAFHHHQLFDAKWKVPVGYDPATPPCTDPANSRLASEEGRLIEVAALAENDEDTLRFVQRFIQMRTERFERWPEIEMLERGTEQVEGSARYVENQYSRCNGRASRLNMPPEALRADRDWLDFGRLYRSGARMLEILDRFEVDWRKRLTAGDDPYGILREVFEDR